MNLSQLLDTDERGVSPVIGVILMVAITVILAAVIGTFVLGLGDQVQETAPNAQFSWAEDGVDDPSSTGGEAILTHESGDSVNTDRLSFVVAGNEIDDFGSGDRPSGTLTAGGTVEIGEDAEAEDDPVFEGNEETIRVVWQSQEGDRTATLTSYTVSSDFGDDGE